MSTHRVEVVKIKEVNKHPDADRLDVIPVWGYTAIAKRGDFKVGDLAVYVEPDYVLPNKPEYAFLDGHLRIKARRLRGVWSQGLLLPAPFWAHEGDDVMERLEITRYEPKPGPGYRPRQAGTGGNSATPPFACPVYDLENIRRHPNALSGHQGNIVVTEKIHGCNARYVYHDGKMHVGSRTRWVKPPKALTWLERAANKVLQTIGRKPAFFTQPGSVWWDVLKQDPNVERLCRANPGKVFYGEVYGQVQDLTYGAPPGVVRFACFDVLSHGEWFSHTTVEFLCAIEGVEVPPVMYAGPFVSLAHLEELSRRESVICPGQLSEGVVVRPLTPDRPEDRQAYKLVSDLYLERNA